MSKSNIIIHKADSISDYDALAYIQEIASIVKEMTEADK